MSEGGASGAPSAGGGGMSVADQNICKAALEVLMSQTNGKKNYLFLEPVDPNFVPNYPEVVKRPMDLGTIKKNLDGAEGAANTFQSREEFWADVNLVFENAIFFHTPIKENAWIIKLAKQMQKVVEREKKKAEKKAVGGGAGAGIVSGATQKKKRGRPPSRSGADAGGDPPKPAVKLKLSVSKAAAAAPTAAAAPQQGGAGGASSATSTTTTKAKPSKPKLKLKLGGSTTGSIGSSSRGKEVPSDVDKAKPAAKVSKPKLKLSISESSGPPPTGKATAGKGRGPGGGKKIPPPAKGSTMSPAEVAQCSKVLSAIHNRNTPEDIQWFLKPVSDPQLVEDYKSKIRYPSDIGTIATKLDKNQYSNVAEFVLDVRRIFANCLRYNTSVNDSFRPLAKKLAQQTEGILALFVAAPAAPKRVYPRLLYCWKLCLSLLDTLLNMTNPTDGHQTAYFFMHPVSFYLGGALPQDYLAKVQTPMDFGTITSRLFEGEYQDVSEFIEDCRLVVDNCRTYYAGREEGKLFIELADRMDGLMAQQLNALKRYDESAAGKREKEAAVTPLSIPVPSTAFLMSVMKEIRDMQYTDKFTKITEPATTIFNLPVNVAMFPDYPNYVSQPMDLSTVESKINSGAYATPEDFEYDINLIFQNCEAYNGPKKNTPLVSLAKYCAKTFKRIYAKKMDDLRAGIGVDIPGKRSASSPEAQPASKRIKLDLSAVPKAAPRISITASKVADATARSTSPKPQGTSSPPKKLDEPVPLHVAIAQIKESFPLRRPAKMLGGWEAACWRMFRELMKHPWLSAARPKFIYSVPVPVLFPSLRDAYAELIKQPMDLTTAEAKLLSGGMYLSAQEFVRDVALVFANALTFNRDGHEEGDPTSCAYFDASKHLLRYARWLSLEHLFEFLANDEHVDVPTGKDELVTAWRLTTGNRKVAREEMEKIALKTPMDLSEEGERYTFMESESDKLLKSLRHQSDARYMYFFIQPVYPPDYSAFISKPMAWDVCNETLQNRQYENIGELVDDLRLIFSNALKYNGGGKGTETISGKAYDSAVYMSTKKLEPAIDRMLLSVSNRIETDKVEQVMQEREIEAEERAEEERLRKAWQEETENAKAQGTAPQAETTTVERIRIIQRRPVRKALDFDFPFNDDDDDNQEPSHLDTMRQQKMIFESQRSDRRKMFIKSISSSSDVYSKMLQQRKAIAWARKKAAATAASVKEAKAASGETLDDAAAGENKDSSKNADSSHMSSSNVGEKANKEREQINEKLKTALGNLKQKKTKKKKKSKAGINVFD